MGFKLVRLDAAEPYKVTLRLGSHLIGRGKLLDCNDNRVSRKHAELIVTSESILLKSMHQNPCFVKKQSSIETLIISQPDSHILTNGDKFGLIPENFWFEVIKTCEDAPMLNSDYEDVRKKLENNELNPSATQNSRNTQLYGEKPADENDDDDINCSQSVLGEEFDAPFNLPPENQTTIQDQNESSNQLENVDSNSAEEGESTYRPEPTTNLHNESDLNQANNPNTLPSRGLQDQAVGVANQSSGPDPDQTSKQNATPNKRLHSEDETAFDVKRIKTEPETPNKDSDSKVGSNIASTSQQAVKQEPVSPQDIKPGPSNVQGPSGVGPNSPPVQQPPSPNKPNNTSRERCWYGANCYRKNPQHLSQFCHPRDADWGGGAQAACPWGAGCRRADPRHWRDHSHPPGAAPAPPRAPQHRPGMRSFHRNGDNFYIYGRSVVINFFEDHFQVDDSDDDSVDFDYEF